MIKLFITDIDGCLSVPFRAPDWGLITQIRELNEQSANEPEIPPLTICSGRPFPYVEAVAQWLAIRLPMVFESAGIYHPLDNKIITNEVFNEDAKHNIAALKTWLKNEIISGEPGMIPEFAKLMDAGLVHPQKEIIQKVLPKVRKYVKANYRNFEVHYTDVSINIVLSKNNKRTGIQDLCTFLELERSEVAYIGDSSGDIP